jgi:hypothetical protein
VAQEGMKLALALVILFSTPVFALVNGSRGSSPHVGMMKRADEGVCTATVVAPGYALTAAHCLRPHLKMAFELAGLSYSVTQQIAHPHYQAKARAAGHVTVDLALIKFENGALGAKIAADLPSIGEVMTLFGFGTVGYGKPLEVLQTVNLKVTGNPGRLQVRLAGKGGACQGDSGGPAFNTKGEIAGVISWSTGKGREICGELTGLTPVSPHREWIIRESAK